MTGVNERARLTIEELATDCLDARELHRRGYLIRRFVPRWPEFMWPRIERIRFDRYLIHIELVNQVTPQNIRVTWTPCNFGGTRPWMHCPHCNRRVARLFKGLSGCFCRECVGGPRYESQCRNTKARAYLKAYRLRERIGGGRQSAFEDSPNALAGLGHNLSSTIISPPVSSVYSLLFIAAVASVRVVLSGSAEFRPNYLGDFRQAAKMARNERIPNSHLRRNARIWRSRDPGLGLQVQPLRHGPCSSMGR
jgi:hypothetical protein